MPTTDNFLGVHQIQDAKNKEDDSSYRAIDALHPNSLPGTYSIRSGSRVRRLNRSDASAQIHRLLEVIRDEYSTFKEEGVNRMAEDFDVIEKAINRIKKQLPDYFRNEENHSSYFCIANFRKQASRLYYKYWETQGDLIRHLGDKFNLSVSSSDRNISNSLTIIPIQQGKSQLTPDDFLNQMKISLLSGGKIVTKGDIEIYCQSRYGSYLTVRDIDRKLMPMEEGKLGRGILVSIQFTERLSAAEQELIRIELQNDLNAKSAFFTLIKVGIHE